MALAIVMLAAMLIASGIRGTYHQLGAQVVKDFTGNGNFFTWMIAIGCVGALGYVPQLQKFSRVFLALILVLMFVRQGTGLFAQFTKALQSAQGTPAEASPGATVTGASSGSASTPAASSGGISGVVDTIANGKLNVPSASSILNGVTGGAADFGSFLSGFSFF